jgi:hypothetical protein
MHKDALFKEMTEDMGIHAAFNEMNEREFHALKDAQRVLYFLINNNLPYLLLYGSLMKLCFDLGATNLQFLPQKKKMQYTEVQQLQQSFLNAKQKLLRGKSSKRYRRANHTVLWLMSTPTLSARKHLAMVSRYIVNGHSKLAFLQDVKLPNGEAETIYNAMKNHLSSAGIPLQKMTSFASDGPAVMVGKKDGVVAHLHRENPFVLHLHCLQCRRHSTQLQ